MSKQSDAWLKLIQNVGNIEADVGKMMQAEHDLGLSEYRALHVLSQAQDGELRMQELALHLSLNQSSVSRMVERLERSGLTVRDLCPDDKRGVYTVLTDKGRARLKSAQMSYEKALDAAIKKRGCRKQLAATFIRSK
jgi:DNA-binding MarR family transcriptional regulator